MEVRCKKCNRLFFRMSGAATIQIKCPKCGYEQTITITAEKRGDVLVRKVLLDKS